MYDCVVVVAALHAGEKGIVPEGKEGAGKPYHFQGKPFYRIIDNFIDQAGGCGPTGRTRLTCKSLLAASLLPDVPLHCLQLLLTLLNSSTHLCQDLPHPLVRACVCMQVLRLSLCLVVSSKMTREASNSNTTARWENERGWKRAFHAHTRWGGVTLFEHAAMQGAQFCCPALTPKNCIVN